MGRRRCIVLAIACATACSGASTSPSLAGEWGGDHIRLTVFDTASHVEFDCAHGDFTGAITSTSFSRTGTFVREHGGPIREGESPDIHPAVYSGSISGSRMTLTVRVTDADEIVGTFTLTRGSSGRVVKCL